MSIISYASIDTPFLPLGGEMQIASLFMAGAEGWDFDLYDDAALFSDSAGTTPAVVDGPVGRLLDKSGNGHHLIQSTSAARPILREAGGVRRLECGSGRYMVSEATVDLSAHSVLSVFHAERLKTSSGIAFSLFFGSSGAGSFDLRHRDGPAGNTGWVTTGAGTGIFRIHGRTTPYASVLGMVVDLTQPTLNSTTGQARALRPRYNGVPAIQTTQGGSWSAGTAFGNYTLALGANAAGSFGADIDFYGGCAVTEAVNEAVAESVETYLSNKAGGIAIGSQAVYAAALGDSTTAEYLGQDTVPALIRYADGAPGFGGYSLALPGRQIAQAQAAWESVTSYSRLRLVTINLGINDLNPAEPAAAPAIARLQSLVDSVNARKPSTCLVYIAGMMPWHQALLNAYGPVDGETAYAKWVALNEAIAGGGATPITGVDRRITSHVATMDAGDGYINPIYAASDGAHPNNAGRQVMADAIRVGMVADGLLP